MTNDEVMRCLSAEKFVWDHPRTQDTSDKVLELPVSVESDPYSTFDEAHAICVLTEWDEFREYDYERVYDMMAKPACIFDGRNILDHGELKRIGFVVYGLGKPLDPFVARS